MFVFEARIQVLCVLLLILLLFVFTDPACNPLALCLWFHSVIWCLPDSYGNEISDA